MTHRIVYYCLIFILFWTGCSGTEFPNPGSDEGKTEMMATETHVEGENNTASAIETADLGNIIPQRFYQYIVNECTQIVHPDFSETNLETSSFEFTQIDQEIGASDLALTEENRPDIPDSFLISQDQEGTILYLLQPIENGLNLEAVFAWEEEVFVGKMSGQIVDSSVPGMSDSEEGDSIIIENCQQSFSTEESLLLGGEARAVQHQQWTYQSSDLPSNILVTVDIYRDEQATGIRQTLQFELTFTQMDDATKSETYQFQLQTSAGN